MRMEDMPKYIEPNWDDILSKVNWTEFDYLSRKFRVGEYYLDGNKFFSVELFLSHEAPTSDGWVGYRWCQQNGKDNDWPPQSVLSNFIKKTSEPIVEKEEPQTSTQPILNNGRIIRPRVR